MLLGEGLGNAIGDALQGLIIDFEDTKMWICTSKLKASKYVSRQGSTFASFSGENITIVTDTVIVIKFTGDPTTHPING